MVSFNIPMPCMKCGKSRVLYDINPGDDYDDCIGDIWWCGDCMDKYPDEIDKINGR